MRSRIYKLIFFVAIISGMVACGDNDSNNSDVNFESTTSNVEESAGAFTVPLQSGTVSEGDVKLSGTAIVDVDYTFTGVDAEGIHFTIFDDDSLESVETIIIQVKGSTSFHVATILCEGTDEIGFKTDLMAGVWKAVEVYETDEFGPYTVGLLQDPVDENKFTMTNFYGNGGTSSANMIFDFDAGTVYFPNQTVGEPGAISASSGTFDVCGTITIELTYDGGSWTYRLNR